MVLAKALEWIDSGGVQERHPGINAGPVSALAAPT